MYIRLQDRTWSVEYIRMANAAHTNGVTHQECDKVVQLYARPVPEPSHHTGGAFASNMKNAGHNWLACSPRGPLPRSASARLPYTPNLLRTVVTSNVSPG